MEEPLFGLRVHPALSLMEEESRAQSGQTVCPSSAGKGAGEPTLAAVSRVLFLVLVPSFLLLAEVLSHRSMKAIT